jgi:aminoglycoside phosphotransferase (APT) family kinase protein
VYSTLLAPQAAQVPHWYGTFLGPKRRTWLVIEYLNDAVPITYLDGTGPITTAEAVTWQASLAEAARWIARFQNSVDARRGGAAGHSLITYDAEYYIGWARRTLRFAKTLPGPAPWLAAVVNGYSTSVVPVLMRHPTFIHGEYYPGNIMLWRDSVYVLDWESAAIGAGEIDLSCLIEGLETDLAPAVIDAYRSVRAPSQADGDIRMALDAATIYLQFRWLGDRREWTIHDSSERHFQRLRAAAERYGLI